MSHLSPAKQAEGIINRLEFAKTAFSDDERNLIVNYAFKLNDMEKTRELAEHIYYEEAEGSQGAALAVIDAQAAITEKQAQRKMMENFMDVLRGLPEQVDYFDEGAWYAMVDFATVYGKEDVRITFKNGMEVSTKTE